MGNFDSFRLGNDEERLLMLKLAQVCEVAVTNYVIDNKMRYPAECVSRFGNEVTIEFAEHGTFRFKVEKV